MEPGKFEGMTEDEQRAMFDACFEYDDRLRANGHVAGQIALQPPETAVTLYWKNGKVATTDGPYAETKEQLAGVLILEARDLNHALCFGGAPGHYGSGSGQFEADALEMGWREAQIRQIYRRSERFQCVIQWRETALPERRAVAHVKWGRRHNSR